MQVHIRTETVKTAYIIEQNFSHFSTLLTECDVFCKTRVLTFTCVYAVETCTLHPVRKQRGVEYVTGCSWGKPAGITESSGISTGSLSSLRWMQNVTTLTFKATNKFGRCLGKGLLSLAGYWERIQLRLLREEYLGTKLFPPWHQAFSFFWVPGSMDSQLENMVQKPHKLQEFVVEQNNFLLLCFIGQWNLCPLLYILRE